MGPQPNAPSDMLAAPKPQLHPNHLAAVTDYLASRGRFGDKILAHLSLPEANLLASLGGAATRNPQTGLLEFYGAEGGSSPDASGGGLGSGASTGDSGTSDSGLGGRQGGLSYGADRSATPGYGGRVSPGSIMAGASGGWNSTSQLALKDPITTGALKAVSDVNNVGNSTWDNIGNLLARVFDVTEMDPTLANQRALAAGVVPQTQADWGLDPMALAANIGGAFVPGVGSGYALARYGLDQAGLLNKDWGKINLGPDVFGGSSGGAQASVGSRGVGTAASAPGSGGASIGGGIGRDQWGGQGGQLGAMAPAMVGTMPVPGNPYTLPWMTQPAQRGGAMNALAALRSQFM